MKNLATAAEQQDGAKQISAQTVKIMPTLRRRNKDAVHTLNTHLNR
jgi:hypothetical protein